VSKPRRPPPATTRCAPRASSNALVEGPLDDELDANYIAWERANSLAEPLRAAQLQVIASMRRYREHHDGRYVLEAFVALRRHDRLSSPRLHRRFGFEHRADLLVPEETRAQILREMNRISQALLGVNSLSQSGDIASVRGALQMDGSERTPQQSRTRALTDKAANGVAALLQVQVRMQRRHLEGKGPAPQNPDMTSIFRAIGKVVGRDHHTVRTMWLRRLKEWRKADARIHAYWQSLYDESIENARRMISAGRSEAAARKVQVATKRPVAQNPGKRAIDRLFKRRR
jgi:hypothetical protein